MSIHQKHRPAAEGGFADMVGRHVYRNGPMSPEELFRAVDSRLIQSRFTDALNRAVLGGWLIVTARGTIACSPMAVECYDGAAAADDSKPIGEIAAPRQQPNVFKRPTLSKQFIPNTRGLRRDIPAWSERPAGFCMKSVAGGEG